MKTTRARVGQCVQVGSRNAIVQPTEQMVAFEWVKVHIRRPGGQREEHDAPHVRTFGEEDLGIWDYLILGKVGGQSVADWGRIEVLAAVTTDGAWATVRQDRP